MGASSLGGFFVELGLKTNENSFAQGQNALNGLSNNVSKLANGIKTALAGAAVVATSSLEQAELKTSTALGIGIDKLDAWKVSANLAGSSAAGLVSSMQNLEQKMQGMKTGQFDESLAKNLAYLGLGYQQFAKMDAGDRVASVIRAAESMEDQAKAAKLVNDVLGTAGADYYNYLRMSGISIDQQLAKSKGLIFTDEKSKNKASGFIDEFRGLTEAGKSIGSLLGSELAGALTPAVKFAKDFIIQNHDLIKSKIVGLGDSLTKGVKALVGVAESMVPQVRKIFNNIEPAISGFFNKVGPFVLGAIEKMKSIDGLIVKVGIGIAALHLAPMVVNLLKVFGALGSIKGVLAGLSFVGIAEGIKLLSNDSNGKDIFTTLKNNIKDFTGELDTTKIKAFASDYAKSIEELIKAVTNSDTFDEGMQKIVKGAAHLTEGTFEMSLTLLEGFTNIIKNLVHGDWTQLLEDQANFEQKLFDAADTMVGGKLSESKKKTDHNVDLADSAINQITPLLTTITSGGKYKADYNTMSGPAKTMLESYYSNGGKTSGVGWDLSKYVNNLPKINDGIISPNGRVASVAPDDWVFAIKEPAKLTDALTNNSNKATQNIVNNKSNQNYFNTNNNKATQNYFDNSRNNTNYLTNNDNKSSQNSINNSKSNTNYLTNNDNKVTQNYNNHQNSNENYLTNNDNKSSQNSINNSRNNTNYLTNNSNKATQNSINNSRNNKSYFNTSNDSKVTQNYNNHQNSNESYLTSNDNKATQNSINNSRNNKSYFNTKNDNVNKKFYNDTNESNNLINNNNNKVIKNIVNYNKENEIQNAIKPAKIDFDFSNFLRFASLIFRQPAAQNENITINQTFTINGNSNTMPQIIRQQAYAGTSEAMRQSINRSQNLINNYSNLR